MWDLIVRLFRSGRPRPAVGEIVLWRAHRDSAWTEGRVTAVTTDGRRAQIKTTQYITVYDAVWVRCNDRMLRPTGQRAAFPVDAPLSQEEQPIPEPVLAEVRGLLRLVGAPEHAVALLARLRTALTAEQPMVGSERR